MTAVLAALERQIRANAGQNLLFERWPENMRFDAVFLECLKQPGLAGAELESTISWLVRRTLKEIFTVNQYLVVDDDAREDLRQIYLASWTRLETCPVEKVLQEHHRALAAWLDALYPPAFRRALAVAPQIGRVANEEYSADFQLRVFGIRPVDLQGCVLDIGCGASAGLVRYLREQGVVASGIDRIVDWSSPYACECDWFAYPFLPETWRTIISNMAFSNHAVCALAADPGLAVRYRQLYRTILDALEPGGTFYYAPAVPVFENDLPRADFEISVQPAGAGIHATCIRRRQ